MISPDSQRYLENLSDELNAATLYEALSLSEENPKLAEIYRRMAETERGHAKTWAEKLKACGEDVPGPLRPCRRAGNLPDR